MDLTHCPYCKKSLTLQVFRASDRCPICGKSLSLYAYRLNIKIFAGFLLLGTFLYVFNPTIPVFAIRRLVIIAVALQLSWVLLDWLFSLLSTQSRVERGREVTMWIGLAAPIIIALNGQTLGNDRLTERQIRELSKEAIDKTLDDSARWSAVFTLGNSQTSSPVPVLIQSLKDPSNDVRQAAAYGLGQIRDPRAIPPLIDALTDPSLVVRQRAVWALRRFNESRASEALKRAAVNDPDSQGWVSAFKRESVQP